MKSSLLAFLIKGILSVVIICGLSSNTFASGMSNWGVIELSYTSGSWTMVTTSGEVVNPDNCESTHHYAINTSAANYEGILSTILAAQMAGKNVRFWLAGCSGQGNRYPTITSVQLSSS